MVLLNFWASWDGPYRAELAHLLKAYGEYHDKGFEIIGISLDTDETAVRYFLKEQKVPWPQYFDGNGWTNSVAKRFAVNRLPASYLLDKEGKIVGKNYRGDALAGALARVFDEKPKPD